MRLSVRWDGMTAGAFETIAELGLCQPPRPADRGPCDDRGAHRVAGA